MKLLYSIVALLLLSTLSLAQSHQKWSWSRVFRGNGLKEVTSTVADINGNIYMLFSHNDTLRFGNKIFPAKRTDCNMTLAKLDQNGNLIYTKKFYADYFTSEFAAKALAVDKDENIYVGGGFTDHIYVGNMYLSDPNRGGGGFIAKFNKSGAGQWIIKVGHSWTQSDRIVDMTVDKDQNIIASGCFYGSTSTYGRVQLHSFDSDINTVVSKIHPSGGVIWATCHRRGESTTYTKVAVDGDNNIYLIGEAKKPLSYDGTTYPVQHGDGIYVSKFRTTGNHVWSRMPKGFNQNYSSTGSIDVVADDSSKIYVGGRLGYTNFLAKFDSLGQPEWVKDMNYYRNPPVRLALDNNSNCYFSASPVVVSGAYLHSITKVSPSSSAITNWKTGFHSFPGYVTSDKANNIYMSGTFRDSVQLGDSIYYTSETSFSDNIYIAKLSAQELVTLENYDKNTYCVGDQVTVYFTQVDTAFTSGNSFMFELSDEEGGFGNPTSLGSKITPFQTDSFKFSIPGNTVEGNSYRVRIRSTSPVYYEVPDNIFAIGTYPQKPIISVSGQSLTATASGGTLQWYKDGQAMPGATGSTFTPTSTGNYAVSVTTSYGCENVSAAQFFIPVGVGEFSIPDIKIHPNPVTDHLIVQNVPVGAVVNMVDVSGRVVHRNTADASQLNIATEHFSSGVYFLVIKLEDGTQQQYKVVK